MGFFLCSRNRTRRAAAATAKSSKGIQIKEEDKRAAKETWKGKTRTLRKSNHVNSKDAVDMITFDFQQNLPTPNLHHTEVFYMGQMWAYNMSIHDCVADQGHMYMFGEDIAKRDINAIFSCLHTY